MAALAPSPRLALARLALDAALAHPDVVGARAGPAGTCLTTDGAKRLEGVSVAAEAGERFAVSLRLLSRPVPLHPLADDLRRRIVTAAASAPAAIAQPGAIGIEFVDIAEDAGARS